jgi:hypothetical protein
MGVWSCSAAPISVRHMTRTLLPKAEALSHARSLDFTLPMCGTRSIILP